MNSINGKKKSRTISLYLKTILSHKSDILLSVRQHQQSSSWHNVLFSFHSNGQITPYFDGFVGQYQWIPMLSSGDHSIILGASEDKYINLQYKDPLVFTRPLSEAEVVALQQDETSMNVVMYPHCLCPEGYKIFGIDQSLCEPNSDDQDTPYISRYKYLFIIKYLYLVIFSVFIVLA